MDCLRFRPAAKGADLSESLWFILTGVLLFATGSACAALGLAVWKKQKIGLVIRHHMDKVSEGNKKAFCTLAGTGVLAVGAGLMASGIWTAFAGSLPALVPAAAGLVLGLALLGFAIRRYNRPAETGAGGR